MDLIKPKEGNKVTIKGLDYYWTKVFELEADYIVLGYDSLEFMRLIEVKYYGISQHSFTLQVSRQDVQYKIVDVQECNLSELYTRNRYFKVQKEIERLKDSIKELKEEQSQLELALDI